MSQCVRQASVVVITCTASGERFAYGVEDFQLWWSQRKSLAKAGEMGKRYAALYEAIRRHGAEAFSFEFREVSPHRLLTEERRVRAEIGRAARAAGGPDPRGRPRKERPRRAPMNAVEALVAVENRRARLKRRLASLLGARAFDLECGYLDLARDVEEKIEAVRERLAL